MNHGHILRLFGAAFCGLVSFLCFVYSTIFLIGYIDMTYINPVEITSQNLVNSMGIYFIPLMYAFGYVLAFLLLGATISLYKKAGGLQNIV
jgi:hypothetical protein